MIAEKELKDFAAKIVKAVSPDKIVLFGSYADGTPTEDSDIDLLVILESDQPKHKRIQAIRKVLRPLPFPVDFVVYTPDEIRRYEMDKGTFVHHVLSNGRVLYAA